MNTEQLHPFLARMVDGDTGTQTKILQNVVSTLQELGTIFRSNAKELVEVIRITDFLVEKTEQSSAKSDEAIKTLASRLSEIEQTAGAIEFSLSDINRIMEQNGADLKNLKNLLGDFPGLLKELKKSLKALDARLAKPLEVKLDFPQSEAVPQELLSNWQSLIVDVTQRNYQGNIETVRIRKET